MHSCSSAQRSLTFVVSGGLGFFCCKNLVTGKIVFSTPWGLKDTVSTQHAYNARQTMRTELTKQFYSCYISAKPMLFTDNQ